MFVCMHNVFTFCAHVHKTVARERAITTIPETIRIEARAAPFALSASSPLFSGSFARPRPLAVPRHARMSACLR